ncbi:hypothetical protein JS533_002885 [Bifidobacterium amazonense]|uniref:Uncharacterized protein n=1 Tax=Bifidobacterium amazonense TaxID=2809027 RepID=A0ABS9VT20_9BIFI|nr:hypothetical protein [Bifidobacterium amazonense]MCH9275223.1 hypothetical protein [Bifidobacterium amazonense]
MAFQFDLAEAADAAKKQAGRAAGAFAGVAGQGIKATGDAAKKARDTMSQAAADLKSSAEKVVEKKEEKTEEKIDEYDQAVIEYNLAYTDLNDAGMGLLRIRERSVDLLDAVTALVNSIANTPKSFQQDIAEIILTRKEFEDSETFARREIKAARESAIGAGAGAAAGMAVASMAPSVAIWAATTFGTASTGTAISTLSGAAATNAALAWLGGGALAAGGGGMAAGNALLAMAGPIGWTMAGATLLTSIVLFAKKRHDIAQERQRELLALKENAAALGKMTVHIGDVSSRTGKLREALSGSFLSCCHAYGADYHSLADEERLRLGALVNSTKALSALIAERISDGDVE